MANKNKQRGYRFENTLMNKIKNHINWDAVRLGQPGQPDLLATCSKDLCSHCDNIREEYILIIECKSTISRTKPIIIRYDQLQTLDRYYMLFQVSKRIKYCIYYCGHKIPACHILPQLSSRLVSCKIKSKNYT